MFRFFRSRSGFTLAEVIIVLVIMGIAATVAVPNVIGFFDNASNRTCSRLMENTMADIRSRITTGRYRENAEVSIDIYKSINTIPLVDLDFPTTVESADDLEKAALEEGTLSGEPLEIRLSDAVATQRGEIYTVDWEFTEGVVNITMRCNYHDEHSLKESVMITYEKKLSDLFSPPKQDNESDLYNALVAFFASIEWQTVKNNIVGEKVINGKTYTYSLQKNGGKLTGDYDALTWEISGMTGLSIEKITEMKYNPNGTPFKITLCFEGDNSKKTMFHWERTTQTD